MNKVTHGEISELIEEIFESKESLLKLFGRLCDYVIPNYAQLSNGIYTRPASRELFERLSVEILLYLRRTYPYSKPAFKPLRDLVARHGSSDTFDAFCLALFRALGEHFKELFLDELKLGRSISAGNCVITARPCNPIYESIPEGRRFKSKYGAGVDDITDLLKYVHLIRETIPKVSFVPSDTDDNKFINIYLKARMRKGMKITVCPFMHDMKFEIASLLGSWPLDQKTPYWFKGIVNRQPETEVQLASTLQSCLDEGVAILVLPELMVDPALLAVAKDWIRRTNRQIVSTSGGKEGLLMVVAGSFHTGESEDKLYNASTILNHRGETIWEHKKLERFAIEEEDIKKDSALTDAFKISPKGGHERIQCSDTLHCIDTPLGRIAVCICLDFIYDREDQKHQEVLKASGVNLFLVPAMSPTVSRFLDTAKNLGGFSLASSFIANSSVFARKKDRVVVEEAASFFYIPDTKQPTSHALGVNADRLTFKLTVG